MLLEDENTISKLQTSLIYERNKREEAEKKVLKLQYEAMYLKKGLGMNRFTWAQNYVKSRVEQMLPYLQITWTRYQELFHVMQRQPTVEIQLKLTMRHLF